MFCGRGAKVDILSGHNHSNLWDIFLYVGHTEWWRMVLVPPPPPSPVNSCTLCSRSWLQCSHFCCWFWIFLFTYCIVGKVAALYMFKYSVSMGINGKTWELSAAAPLTLSPSVNCVHTRALDQKYLHPHDTTVNFLLKPEETDQISRTVC